MGDLIKTQLSEIVATMEVLDRHGVTVNGLKNLRTMSPILAKQIARLIEDGTGTVAGPSKALDVFFLVLDSKKYFENPELLKSKGVFNSLFVFEILKACKKMKDDEVQIVILKANDVLKTSLKTFGFGSLFDEAMLRVWSNYNILNGYYIRPFKRSDTAIHFATRLSDMMIEGEEFTVITENKKDIMTVYKAESKASTHTVVPKPQPFKTVSEYLVFELKKHE